LQRLKFVPSQLQSSLHIREQLAHIAVQQGATPTGNHSNSKSDHIVPRRIGVDNDRVFDSFDMADIGNTTNTQVNRHIASGNTDLSSAFNEARMGNTFGPPVGQVSGGTSAAKTAYTMTVASNNHHLHDVFEGAVMGNTSSFGSSAFIASGNKHMSRSFNGARMGECCQG
jgi:hypothetical protein